MKVHDHEPLVKSNVSQLIDSRFQLHLSMCVNPKGCGGGGAKVPTGQEIACHFSQDHTVVTKILDFIHKHLNLKVVKSFFHYLDRFFRNLAKIDTKLGFLGIENHKIDFFSTFLYLLAASAKFENGTFSAI